MSRKGPRTQSCTRADARTRLQQAETMLIVADLALSDDSDVATPGVAAALTVLAAIAASDAACCAQLGERARGKEHSEAAGLLATVEPGGAEMAKEFRAVIVAKDESHYGLTLVSATKARRMLTRTRRLIEAARVVVDS